MAHFLDDDGALPAVITLSRSRALAGGIDPNQYDQVTADLKTLREWPATFIATGHQHLERAQAAEASGCAVTAGDAYLSAAAWFHFATTVPAPGRAGHQEASEAMRSGLAHIGPTAQRLTGQHMVGILRRPAHRTEGPLVVIVPGMDSSKEEFHSVADALLRRGVATLAIDGPGQGELAPTTTPIADYHRVVSDALDTLDAADTRGWQPTVIGLIALSLGGYYGAVSLAHEPRLRAGVVVSGPYKLTWEQLPQFVTDTLILRTGDPAAAKRFADRIDLADAAPLIDQPLLVVDGGQDVIPGVINGQPLAERAPHGEYLLIPEGDHLVGNTRWKWLPAAADWLAQRLAE
jgi:pimeloyl-ACP methyl ester carboxylesterase